MKTAIVNLGAIISGEWREPYVKGDSILMEGAKIAEIGTGRGKLPTPGLFEAYQSLCGGSNPRNAGTRNRSLDDM